MKAGQLLRRTRIALFALAAAVPAACAPVGGEREPLLSPPHVAEDEETAEFVSVGDRFASPAACESHLVATVGVLPSAGYEIARGPYALAPGDVRAHGVRADSGRFQVLEYRCFDSALQLRSWWTGPATKDRPFTLEGF